MIGEKDSWGKGYGTEATRLTLDYGFSCLGLNSIMLRVFSFNERALRTYLPVGFREIGRWRRSHRLGQSISDTVFMDIVASDFESPSLGRLLPIAPPRG